MEKFIGLNALHIRLTLTDMMDEIIKWVKVNSTRYIVSDEISHYHLLVVTQSTIPEIRKNLKEAFPLKGNGSYSVAQVRSLKQMKKYILKDGHYQYKGFDDEEISLLRKQSTQKGNSNFQEKLQVIEDRYGRGEIDYREFQIEYIKLKIDFGQNIYKNHLQAFFTRILLRYHPEQIGHYVDQNFHGTYTHDFFKNY